jgi:hypothetical protein
MPNTWTFGPNSGYTASWDGGGPIALSAPAGGGTMNSWEPQDLGSLAVAGLALAALPPSTAADTGLLAQNFDGATAGGTSITTAGTLYLMRLNIRAATTVSNICLAVSGAGNNTGGSTGTFAGLYNPAGTLLSGSADVAASLTSTGFKALPLTTPQALAAGTFAWAAILTNLGTTQPTLCRAAPGINAVINAGLAASALRIAVNGTSLTALPATVTPGSNTAAGALAFWTAFT